MLSLMATAAAEGKLFLLYALVGEKVRGQRREVWEHTVEGADL
jgi:hypothetical protein